MASRGVPSGPGPRMDEGLLDGVAASHIRVVVVPGVPEGWRRPGGDRAPPGCGGHLHLCLPGGDAGRALHIHGKSEVQMLGCIKRWGSSHLTT